jgi:hypothetical protein
VQIQKEREKHRTGNIIINKEIRQDARFEMILDEIKSNVKSIKPPKFGYTSNNFGKKIGILGISDIHYNKIFESINNSYSIDICKARMQNLLCEVVDLVQENDLVGLHIINAGDSVDGLLRVNQLRVLEMGVVDSVISFSALMAEWLNELSAYIPITYHHVMSSNHTEIRFLNTKAGSFPDEDFEKIIVQYLRLALKNNNNVNIPIYQGDNICFEIFNKKIMGFHGHQFHGKKSENIIKEVNMLYDTKTDILIMGHRHHEEIYTVGENKNGNVKVIILPSIIGSDSYSDKIFAGSKSGATMIILSSDKKGIMTQEVILN